MAQLVGSIASWLLSLSVYDIVVVVVVVSYRTYYNIIERFLVPTALRCAALRFAHILFWWRAESCPVCVCVSVLVCVCMCVSSKSCCRCVEWTTIKVKPNPEPELNWTERNNGQSQSQRRRRRAPSPAPGECAAAAAAAATTAALWGVARRIVTRFFFFAENSPGFPPAHTPLFLLFLLICFYVLITCWMQSQPG